MKVPSNRCGFELKPQEFIERSSSEKDRPLFIELEPDEWRSISELEPDEWHSEFNVSCCWRPVWNDTHRCIWHAEIDDKPIEDLIAARSEEPNPVTLDGIFLQNLELGDSIPFQYCRLIGADFSGANLVGADFTDANLFGANFTEADLVGIDFTEADLVGANFLGADLSEGNLGGADILDADLSGANLSGAWLRGTDLSGVDLRGADLSGAWLMDADLSEANLLGAVLSNAQLVGATLLRADLEGAALPDANLSYADLSDTHLEGAALPDADLTEANLSSTDLRHADLRRATFHETTLSNLRMNSATRFERWSFYSIWGFERWTLYPISGGMGLELSDTSSQESHAPGEETKADVLIGKARRLRLAQTLGRKNPEFLDPHARAYHALGEEAKDNGLTGKARRLRIWERKARQKEAFWKSVVALMSLYISVSTRDLKAGISDVKACARNLKAWVGLFVSGYLMGYGISIKQISKAIVVIIFLSALVYWGTDIRGGETFLQAIDYSVTTFTGAGPASGLPNTQPARSVVILESFAGILFSVLLGYVLGTRESP